MVGWDSVWRGRERVVSRIGGSERLLGSLQGGQREEGRVEGAAEGTIGHTGGFEIPMLLCIAYPRPRWGGRTAFSGGNNSALIRSLYR